MHSQCLLVYSLALVSWNSIQLEDCDIKYIFFSRQELQRQFAKDRNWDQYHTPRNLLMALVGEVGELAEILYVVSAFMSLNYV